MPNYTTIGELIENLKGEDLSAPIIYQYYLAEHFEISEEVFAEVARDFDSLIPCSDSYEVISREIDNKNQGNVYRYKGTTYCEQDLERAKREGWHND